MFVQNPYRSGGALDRSGYRRCGGSLVCVGRKKWSTWGGVQSGSGWSVSKFLVVTGLGWRRCCSRLTWTTRVLFLSEICIVTGLLMDLIVQFPSHRESSLPAVGIESHRGSPSVNVRTRVLESYATFWLVAACAKLVSTKSRSSAILSRM